MTEPDFDERPSRLRSPSYPSINLEDAIERTKTLHLRLQMNPGRIGVVASALGYSVKSGPLAGIISALIKFGLAEGQGSGEARTTKITEMGRRIVLRSPDSSERITLVKEAALRPAIHRDLWERFGPCPPDDLVIRDYLVVDRKFNQSAVAEFIAEYRETLAFAGLIGDGTVETEADDSIDGDFGEEPPMASQTALVPTRQAAAQRYTPAPTLGDGVRLPLFNKALVTINWEQRLSVKEWEAMADAIKALGPLMASSGDGKEPDGE
ncbi:MAG: hypothetical protein IT300_13255 [Dehalococcoidia bacterium]|nr:hypothetical protein [Dehalococcoidia bacterium]